MIVGEVKSCKSCLRVLAFRSVIAVTEHISERSIIKWCVKWKPCGEASASRWLNYRRYCDNTYFQVQEVSEDATVDITTDKHMERLRYILGFFFLALSERLFDTNETPSHGCIGPDSRAREKHHVLTIENTTLSSLFISDWRNGLGFPGCHNSFPEVPASDTYREPAVPGSLC